MWWPWQHQKPCLSLISLSGFPAPWLGPSPCLRVAAAELASGFVSIPVGLLGGPLWHTLQLDSRPASGPSLFSSCRDPTSRSWSWTSTCHAWGCQLPHGYQIIYASCIQPQREAPMWTARPWAASPCCSLTGDSLFCSNFFFKCNFLLVNCNHLNVPQLPCSI